MSDLQAVLKDVERAGTKFQQKYWVSIDEVKTMVKKEGWKGAIDKMGGSSSAAYDMLKQWTSWPSKSEAQRMQGAAMAVMGGKPSEWPVGNIGEYKDGLAAGHADEKRQKTVVALQAATRAGLENLGYKPRTMYRGMSGPIADQVVAAAKAQADAGVPYHEAAMSLTLNALSSFSEDEALAGGSFGPVVIALHEVPAHAYVGHFRVQGKGTVGTPSEEEGVIMSFKTPHAIGVQDIRGSHAKTIIDYFKSKNLFDASKIDLDDHPPSKISNKRIGNELPAAKVKVDVPLLVMAPKDVAETIGHLKESGAEGIVHSSNAANALSTPIKVTVPSHKLDEFVKKFSTTPSFDSTKHKPESLKAYMEGKAKAIAYSSHDESLPDFGDGKGNATVESKPSASPKVPGTAKPAKQYKGNLPTVSELPDLPADVASIPVQQKKGKGAVPEWAGKKTWRDLWTKWAKQEAVAAGHSPKEAGKKGKAAVDKANVDLKKFVHHSSPSKAQFKAFFAKVIAEHVKKK